MSATQSRTSALAVLVLAAAACTESAGSPRGFALPEGDSALGREAFVSLQCTTCHTVRGVDLPSPGENPPVEVALGGATTRVKTYADLVTSIINPSHKLAVGYAREDVARDGVSRMANYNSVLTVAELIDLVAFLQPTYEVVRPEFEYYPYY